MVSLTKAFSAAEFLVDEKPVELTQLKAAVDSKGSDPSVQSVRAEVSDSGRDVLSILSEMMIERGALLEETEKLKTSKPQDDEFGKFAKQTVHFVDAMERILQLGKAQPPSDEIMVWLQGVESAYKRILRLFEKHQLQVVSAIGQEVDLGAHDVIEYRVTKDYPHNTIIEEPLKGIVFRGRALREAKVVVACNQ